MDMADNRYKTIHGEDGDDLHVLTSPHSLMDKVGLGADPTDFGLPDLLEEGLSRDEQDAGCSAASATTSSS